METLGQSAEKELVDISNPVVEFLFDLEKGDYLSLMLINNITEEDDPCIKFLVNVDDSHPSEEVEVLVEITPDARQIFDEEGYDEGFYNMLCDTTMRLADELGPESRLVSALAVFLSEEFYPQNNPLFDHLVFKVWEATKMFVPDVTIH